ncbi:type II secretion system F family protein [Ureibacillus thermosphaericus]|uniref:Type IV pilus assembly protein PilC n=1 Tax=Ureibacillus thermosphaericus TaxID=51173 RepID=A0A840PP05_URETH|nr:type II secretion system F family protein [Ureibacillus thermosphaericus]MBB5147773.1 type IV pilus assembly protein PilC [Ureibacillus thermosphaericus]NKZ30425.1 type II secretion system F family protein [Ureibacillus thermosphaericus]
MTIYRYVGRTKTGQVIKGKIDATSKKAAIAKLREKGINPREVNQSSSILDKELNFGGGKVKNQEFVIYCRQFATLIRAGVSIVDSTNILSRQTKSKPLKKALEMVEEDIRTGISFSDATKKHPKVFPELFTNMIASAEVSGNMDITLDKLATTFEKQYNLKKKIQSTMTYPLILLVLTIAVAIFMMVFIVPSFTESFESMGAELPTVTIITIKISDWLRNFWWVVLGILVIAIVLFYFLYKNNKEFHYTMNYLLLKFPIFGPLLQKSVIARMVSTLSSLFSSAVPILQSLTIVEKVVGNPVISQVVREARDSLEKGSPLSEPLAKSWLFPPLVTSMISIGESTGSLDYMLEKVAEFYEAEVERNVDTLKSLIEPIMILFLAVIVGGIVAAIFLPMFSLYEQM